MRPEDQKPTGHGAGARSGCGHSKAGGHSEQLRDPASEYVPSGHACGSAAGSAHRYLISRQKRIESNLLATKFPTRIL